MKYPECEKEMRWVGDQLLQEDDVCQMVYDCSVCKIEVIKSVETAADKGILVV